MSKTVINKRSQIIWDNGFAPDGQSLPKVSTTDAGKVLTVDEEGKWSAGEASGGTEYTAGDNIQISADNVISATDTTYTAGDNVAISADNEISSVNTIVFNAKYFRATDTFQYDADAIAPFLTEVYKNDKRAIVRVQDANYNIYDIYTLIRYESTNNNATFTKSNPIIVSANQREIICAYIKLSVSNNVGTLTFTSTGVTDLPEGATAGQIPISDGHSGWVAGNIPSELPSVSSADEGKVLKVDSNGDWAVGTDDDTKYTAGTNVQINGSVISATDTTYTAGTNVQITNGVISATDTTYTAGNGITITGTSIAADAQLPEVTSSDEGNVLTVDSQGNWVPDAVPKELPTVSSADEGKILTVDDNGNWVKGANDAGMVKAAIADDYAGADGTLPFYPIFSDAIASNANMTRDCFVAQDGGWAGTAGARPYSATRNDIYMAIVKDGSGNYGILLFTTGPSISADGSVKIQYIKQDGTLSELTSIWITESFTGTINSGYYDHSIQCIYHENYSLTNADLITCAKDLSLCVYNSVQDAVDAFGAWQIPGSYNEGDQVWKDGKLQTYTNGDWVDSDPIVEQIANAGGGSAGETLTLLANHTTASSQTKAWGSESPIPVTIDLTNVDLTGYEKFLVTIDGTGNNIPTGSLILSASNQYLINGRYLNNKYTFEPYFVGKFSNGRSTSPSYNVYMRIQIAMTSTYLYLWAYSDKLGTSSQAEQQPYLFGTANLDVKLYGIK